MKKRKWIWMGILISCLLSVGCGKKESKTDNIAESEEQLKKVRQIVSNIEERKQKEIQLEDNSTKIVFKGDTAEFKGEGITFQAGVLTITEGGCYEVSGELSDGRIEINASEKAEVQIIFNEASIKCSNYAPFVVWQADRVVVALEDGTENSILDTCDEYQAQGTEEKVPTAAVYSKSDLVFVGNGKLCVETACNDGITSKDDLVIQGGDYDIVAVDDGLVGKDSVQITEGNFVIRGGDDGIKSSEDTDSEKGYVSICGGKIDITAGDDGIHGESAVVITDGEIDIQQSYEGIEAETLYIQDGKITIAASDDGLNAANGQSAEGMDGRGGFAGNPANSRTGTILIEGGSIAINADGDGVDSNGSIYVQGGDIFVNGPTNDGNGILDYDGELVMTGGRLVGAGSHGMLQSISDNSTQPGMAVVLDSHGKAGDEVLIKDSNGKTICSFTPEKEFSAVVVSCPELEVGATYEVTVAGSTAATIELSSVSVSNGSGGMGGSGGAGGPGGSGGMGRPGDAGGPGGSGGMGRPGDEGVPGDAGKPDTTEVPGGAGGPGGSGGMGRPGGEGGPDGSGGMGRPGDAGVPDGAGKPDTTEVPGDAGKPNTTEVPGGVGDPDGSGGMGRPGGEGVPDATENQGSV